MPVLANARVFDGRRMLPGSQTVTVEGNRISAMHPHSGPVPDGAVDVAGMTLMPGLITSHLHPDFFKFSIAIAATERPGRSCRPASMMAIGVRTCRVLLESGFTGYSGASCAHDIDAQLKMAIAEDIIPGPRIRACGHHLGTTGDMNNSGRWWKRYETPGTDVCADGPDAMRSLVREEINRGVETIKIFASAGHGQLHRTTRNMSRDEIATIISTAHERGAKVRAHVSDKAMMLECIELGLDLIDHGDEIDEEVIAAMVEAGTFWVPSLIYPWSLLELGYAAEFGVTPEQYEHTRAMLPRRAGSRGPDTDRRRLQRHLPRSARRRSARPPGRKLWSRVRLLRSDRRALGSRGAELGYPQRRPVLGRRTGAAGVIEPGALADLIVVDGDPLADLSLLSRPAEALKAVIRDGVFVIDRMGAVGAEGTSESNVLHRSLRCDSQRRPSDEQLTRSAWQETCNARVAAGALPRGVVCWNRVGTKRFRR